jgi:hypothetical protein
MNERFMEGYGIRSIAYQTESQFTVNDTFILF